MPKDPVAPLIVANKKEKSKSWEDLQTPEAFANWFQTVFAVDLGTFSRIYNLYIGPNEPAGGDRGKIHFKTSRPIGIGALIQGSYEYIYAYPPNVPFIVDSDSVPVGVTALTSEELSKYDLSNGTDYVWVMLKV